MIKTRKPAKCWQVQRVVKIPRSITFVRNPLTWFCILAYIIVIDEATMVGIKAASTHLIS